MHIPTRFRPVVARRLCVLACVFLTIPATILEAGVTFATHGHNDFSGFGLPSDLMSTDAYLVPQIAEPISRTLGSANVAIVELLGTRSRGEWNFEERLRSPAHPSDTPAIGELVVLMNWESVANGSIPAQEAGDAFADFILRERPEWISRFGNVAAIGHSRGAPFIGSFVSTLGTSNVLVDSLAYLDTSVNSNFSDQTPAHADNVVFAQSLKQTQGNSLLHGIDISGATNLDVTPLLASLSGFPQAPFDQEPHFFVLNVFGDTIDQSRDTSFPYGGSNIDRTAFGGQYLHFAPLAHSRPLEGLHPVVGGSATTTAVSFEDNAKPAITIAQDSRAGLLLGTSEHVVDLVYRDPDSQELSLRVLIDKDQNLFDGFGAEILSLTLDGGQADWQTIEDFNLRNLGDEPSWIHFELSDGVNTSHSTFPLNGVVVPEPNGILLLAAAMALLRASLTGSSRKLSVG